MSRGLTLRALLAAFLLAVAAHAGAACTPNVGRWTVNSTTVTYEVCAADGATWAAVGGGGEGASLPAGMIAMFNGACPSGWSELTAARGRTVVGVPAAGTLAATVGTALTDAQDRSVTPTFTGDALGTHTHTYTDVVNHTHTVSVNDPGHTHLTQRYPTATGASSGFTIDTSMSGTLADNTLPTKTATTGITASTVNPAGGVATGTTAGTSGGTPAGSVSAVTTSGLIAYIQLRYCQKD